jgi:hypothetical protein
MMTGRFMSKKLREAGDMFERFNQMATRNTDPLANPERLEAHWPCAETSASSRLHLAYSLVSWRIWTEREDDGASIIQTAAHYATRDGVEYSGDVDSLRIY